MNQKLEFMRNLNQYDPRWKDKLRAKKKMELKRLEQRRAQLEFHAENMEYELGGEIDHQIKDTKYDIYKLQKYSDIRQELINERYNTRDAHLYDELHQETEKDRFQRSKKKPKEEIKVIDESSESEEIVVKTDLTKPRIPPQEDNRKRDFEREESWRDGSQVEGSQKDDDLLQRIQEKHVKRQESLARKRKEREEKEAEDERKRKEKAKKDKLEKEKQAQKREEEREKQRRKDLEERQKQIKKEKEEREKLRKKEEKEKEQKRIKAEQELIKQKKAQEKLAEDARKKKLAQEAAEAKAKKTKSDGLISKFDAQKKQVPLSSDRKSLGMSSRPSHGKTIEDEDSEESDDNFGGLKGSFTQGEKTVTTTVKKNVGKKTPKASKNKMGKLSILLQTFTKIKKEEEDKLRAKKIAEEKRIQHKKAGIAKYKKSLLSLILRKAGKIILEKRLEEQRRKAKVKKKNPILGGLSQKVDLASKYAKAKNPILGGVGGKEKPSQKPGGIKNLIMGTVGGVANKKPDPRHPAERNEIEIAGVDSEQYTSTFEEGEEIYDTESNDEDINELLQLIRKTDKRLKERIIDNLMKYIKTFEEFDSGNITNLDMFTSELYSNLIDNKDKWKTEPKISNIDNCFKVLCSIMLSEKENNFNINKFVPEHTKFNKSQN